MKIYANLTNEKGKVDGMGANENLTIEITGGNQLLARIIVTESTTGYLIETYPVASPDQLALDVKGHGYKLTRKKCVICGKNCPPNACYEIPT